VSSGDMTRRHYRDGMLRRRSATPAGWGGVGSDGSTRWVVAVTAGPVLISVMRTEFLGGWFAHIWL
ncbi:hypothetical protein, partial [Kitasatospora sp. NPDC057541]|uniref:hypothetical protein n=1 Tax=unclassified Kitasatospora TaxID=2633591 RepID=UPI003690F4BB